MHQTSSRIDQQQRRDLSTIRYIFHTMVGDTRMSAQFIRVHLGRGPSHNGFIHAVLLNEHRSKSICASEIHHSLEHA
jgi:hypothetical protein